MSEWHCIRCGLDVRRDGKRYFRGVDGKDVPEHLRCRDRQIGAAIAFGLMGMAFALQEWEHAGEGYARGWEDGRRYERSKWWKL